MPAKVTIIVLNWNNAPDTVECIESLAEIDYPTFDILLVDNGSTDGSADRLARRFPDIELLRLDRNLGFAGGNNRAMERAIESGAEYLLLLNNDTIVDKDILSAFVSAHEECDNPGFLGAKIYYHSEPDRIWAALTRWDADACRFEHIGNNEREETGGFARVSETSYASGCALFFASRVVRQIGLFDERFFCYFEEVDLCFRARKAGFCNYFVPHARLWHKVSASSGGKTSPTIQYFRTRNTLLWARRQLTREQRRRVWRSTLHAWIGSMTWCKGYLPVGPKRLYWNLVTLRRDPMLRAQGLAVRDALLHRYGDAPASVKTLS